MVVVEEVVVVGGGVVVVDVVVVVEEVVVVVVLVVVDVVVVGAGVVVVVDGELPTYVTTPPTIVKYVPARIGVTCKEGVASNELSNVTDGVATFRTFT